MANPTVPLSSPSLDPTPVFEFVRWSYGSELLTAAVAYFDLFSLLGRGPLDFDEIARELKLSPRATNVLVVALRAMKLLDADSRGKVFPSPLARQSLVPGGEFYMGDYVSLTFQSPGVKNLVERLRSDKPIETHPEDKGVGFIFREGMESAMDHEDSARRLTLSLAGRARIVAPALAAKYPLAGARRLLDIGGGSGLYSVGFVRANPGLRAVVWDRAPVLNVAREMAERFGVSGRIELVPGDMFASPIPSGCDVMLLSNILHDWDIPDCQKLLGRCAQALPAGGRVLIHDVFLNDELDGPLPVAFYSAALFNVTEGRAYSAGEYKAMLRAAGLTPEEIVPTAVHCGVLAATKK